MFASFSFAPFKNREKRRSHFFLLHLRLCLQKKYKAYLKTGGNSQKYGVNRKILCSLNIQ